MRDAELGWGEAGDSEAAAAKQASVECCVVLTGGVIHMERGGLFPQGSCPAG